MRRFLCIFVTVALVYGALHGRRVSAAPRPVIAGTWTLNPDASAFPTEVGFDLGWEDSESGTGIAGAGGRSASGQGGGGRGGSRGGGGSSGAPPATPRFESEEDSRKIRELVNEVKTPAARLTITQTDSAVTIGDGGGKVRTFRAGKEDTFQLIAGPIAATSKWEGTHFVVRYAVEKDRELRYRYSRDPAGGQLIVEVQFAERGRGDVIRRVYDPQPVTPQ